MSLTTTLPAPAMTNIAPSTVYTGPQPLQTRPRHKTVSGQRQHPHTPSSDQSFLINPTPQPVPSASHRRTNRALSSPFTTITPPPQHQTHTKQKKQNRLPIIRLADVSFASVTRRRRAALIKERHDKNRSAATAPCSPLSEPDHRSAEP
ncbi:leucine-rich repeat extensin-like protein 7 [Iris pallida]|uniref:Leucine-rich repeat extensin-like protein 7 n=1 Tax=Iris pallida TaxID=29817 RepID=A0AAX6F8A8_IRIPA|nr:leucine-rich repeat extensin-like protein 7 [Iris pallida]